MRRAIRYAVLALVPLTAASCSTTATTGAPARGTVALTRVGEAVQVTENPVRAQECEFISDLPLQSSSPDDTDAMRVLRNQAGAAGANLVLLVMDTRTTIDRAEGYLCADE